ncbi:MAG: class I SAM-dependent methyltransferase [Chloroflexaceae bacterium]|nr:class I SAM-dependent methyltransferase [Chloroflexaceae bacterium]
MNPFAQRLKTFADKALAEKKVWYESVAAAYHRTRPRYPQALCDRAVVAAELNARSRILEIGCGPGTATVAFAPLGCEMICLEPNAALYELARTTCASYPNVTFHNLAFEDWTAVPCDAVLAATSIHWIAPEVLSQDCRYPESQRAVNFAVECCSRTPPRGLPSTARPPRNLCSSNRAVPGPGIPRGGLRATRPIDSGFGTVSRFNLRHPFLAKHLSY